MVRAYAHVPTARLRTALPMTRRMSRGRRMVLVTVALLGMVAWTLGLIAWTTFGRASTSGGFVDITVETIQSPAGLTASTTAIVDQVDAAARQAGNAISAQGNAALTTAVGQVLGQPSLGAHLATGIDAARQALADHPDSAITIDVAALRDQIVARLQPVSPQLAASIPPASSLTITVTAADVPSGVSTAASVLALMKWVPLWLVIAAVILLGIGFLVTDDWTRTARRLGIAFIALGIVPVLIRLIVPPLVGGFGSGTQADIIEVAAAATIANWWIALMVTLIVGIVLLAAGIVLRHPARAQSGPVVLGR